jgi:hypothetical protein
VDAQIPGLDSSGLIMEMMLSGIIDRLL